MQSTNNFKVIPGDSKQWLVLIPGWATDHRIFEGVETGTNCLLPLDFSPDTFGRNLLETIKELKLNKISLFGWSMGGFLAAEFAQHHADLLDRLILVSIRREYDKPGLDKIRGYLNKSKKGYLYRFYTHCFYGEEDSSWPKRYPFSEYYDYFTSDYLFKTLDYLESAQLTPQLLKHIDKITIIHGEGDNISPFKEAVEVKNELACAKFICVEKTGHIPFFRRDLKRWING